MGGGTKTSSTQTSSGPPSWLGNPFAYQAMAAAGLTNDGRPMQKQKAGAFKHFLLDPNASSGALSGMQQFASGQYLNPDTNPALMNYIGSMEGATNRGIAQQQAALRSRYALAGHTSTGASSPLLEAQRQLANQGLGTMQEALAPQLLGAYQNARNQQMGALGQIQGMNMLPYNMLRDVASLYSTGASKTTVPTANPLMSIVGK